MAGFVSWDSQPLDTWAESHAEGEFIELAGKQTHYIERGEGEPLLLLHGFNLDWHTWMANVEELAKHYKVYALDLWGQGLSTREPLDYSYELFVEQIHLFMEALGIAQANLIGHSMGGGTAIEMTLRHRQRVNKLVLVGSTGIPYPLPFRATVFKLPLLPEFLQALPTNFVRRKNLADFWIYNRELLTEEVLTKFTQSQKIQGSAKAVLTILRKDFFHTLEEQTEQLGKLNIPTLIVWGRQDKTIPISSAERIRNLLQGSKLEILDPAGHLVNFDQADRFNRIVIDFLAG
jgi:pimeloyl-ACP methyl ester carboxylesterase